MKSTYFGIVFLLLVLFSFGNGNIVKLNKIKGRTITPETVAFQIIYLGSCSQFFSIPTISISSQLSLCLPINTASQYPDLNDLTADVLCTDVAKGRAEIDFMEIYLVADGTPLTTPFIISFTSNAPYKAIGTGISYYRRPSCEIDQDYCSTTDYVKSCTVNNVQLQNGFVVSKDEVYIIPAGPIISPCSTAENTCCSYITPGFCPRTADDSVFRIKFNKPQSLPQPHHEEHHEEHHHNDHDEDEDDEEHRHHHGKQAPPQQDVKAKNEKAKQVVVQKIDPKAPLMDLLYPSEEIEEPNNQKPQQVKENKKPETKVEMNPQQSSISINLKSNTASSKKQQEEEDDQDKRRNVIPLTK